VSCFVQPGCTFEALLLAGQLGQLVAPARTADVRGSCEIKRVRLLVGSILKKAGA
jgi:hypothetical protein